MGMEHNRRLEPILVSNTNTQKRKITDARKVLSQALTISQVKPTATVTDGLSAYPDAINKEFIHSRTHAHNTSEFQTYATNQTTT